MGAALERGAEGGLLRAGSVIEKNAQDEAPIDTGSLRSSIKCTVRGKGTKMVVTIGPNVKSKDGAPYDVYQEFGTGVFKEGSWLGGGSKFIGGNIIRPRKAKALAWRGKPGGWGRAGGATTKSHGGMVFAKWTRGTKPKKYMQKGIEQTDVPAEFCRGFNATK